MTQAIISDEVRAEFAPWEPSTYRGAPMTGAESWDYASARFPFLVGWRGVTPEALLAARYHPDAMLKTWLNAILTAEEAKAEVIRRRDAGLGPSIIDAAPAGNDNRLALPAVGWANAYD